MPLLFGCQVMTKKLLNVKVDSLSTIGNKQAAARFEIGDGRYHLWFDIETLKPQCDLYKNPLLSVDRHDPAYQPKSDFMVGQSEGAL